MSEIARVTLFGKLNSLAYVALEGATVFCKLRGNPYVELVHWVQQILNHQDSDWHRVLRYFDVDASRLAIDVTLALDKLPRGSTSISDLSTHVESAVERGWVYGSLMYGETRVRTGHLLIGLLKTPSLHRVLDGMSPQFQKLNADVLTDRFGAILNGSPEDVLFVDDTLPAAEPGEASSATVPRRTGTSSALKQYAVDLTERARSGELDPIFGRDAEIRQLIDILLRRRQNNPILTGEAGVGKTAVVEGLAARIAKGEVPEPLKSVSVYALDFGLLQAGASMKGEFENRLRQVIDEVQSSTKPIILFIDEAHTLIGAGGAAGTGDAANLLKPALARGKLRTIAATTWAEYKKHIEKDPALTRRFQVVQVVEPDEAKALVMMRGIASMLEKHHRVLLLDEAIEAAVRLSHRYIPARQLPDKAVSVLDTACARVALSQGAMPAEVEDARRRIEFLQTELDIVKKEAAVGVDIGDRAIATEEKLKQARLKLDTLGQRWSEEKSLVERILALRAALHDAVAKAAESETTPEIITETETRAHRIAELNQLQTQLKLLQTDAPLITPAVDEQAVASVVQDWTGVPVGRMVKNEIASVLKLADTLSERVLGQRHGLDIIARRIQTARAKLDNPDKPIGAFMLCGPSGVGKTETALALAEALYGGEQNVITINMSEFQEAHTVSTLKGAPPGYVGYGEGGVLTEAVRRRPYSVVLLDEVEKAHHDVHEIFFQVFDKGWMDDGEGRRIDFKNTIILLTTNVGTEQIAALCNDPNHVPEADQLAQALREPLLRIFPAALLGRLVTIPYYPLSDAVMNDIIRLQLNRIKSRVAQNHRASFVYDDAVVQLIAKRCTEVESGGRMIDSMLTNTVLPSISQEYLQRLTSEQTLSRISLSAHGEAFVYHFD